MSRWVHRQSTDWVDVAIALAVAGLTLVILVSTMQMGFTRDESFYFHAAYQYIGWFEELWANVQQGQIGQSFTRENVDQHWSYNPEHPVLMKTLFALSHALFHEKLGWLSASSAMRLPGAMSASLLMSIVYLWARQLFGRKYGLLAVALLLTQPRFFFHAHLTCFDVPVIFVWTAVVYAYWRSLDSRGWGVACGLFFGLALSTKLNAFFLPVVLVGHWVLANARDFGVERGPFRLRIPGVPHAFVWMAILGPILFYALWPRHWFETTARVQWYLEFHLKHVHYFVYYFGQNIQQPPFPISYPFVMTLVTVPVSILAAFFAGALGWIHNAWKFRVEVSTGLLMAINVIFPMALIAMPETPIFGGVKHWMTAAPFLAIVAAGGVAWALHGWNEGWQKSLIAVALSVIVVAPAANATRHIHPFGTSYYNELVGGVRGAADLEMMRQFWGYASRQGLEWLDDHAPQNARVWTHNTTGYAWSMYRRDELVRSDLRPSSVGASDYALYHHQKAFVFRLIEVYTDYGTRAPVHVVDIDGVPVLSIYERPGTRKPVADQD